MTRDELKDLIILARQVEWRYRLDQFETAALKDVVAAIDQVKAEVADYISARGRSLGEWSEDRAFELLDELDDLTVGVKAQTANQITDIATIAASDSLTEQADILSFGGRVRDFNNVSLGAEQLRSLAVTEPVGGKLLADWVADTFDANTQAAIRREILTGSLKGEGYQDLVRRMKQGFDMTAEDAITLTRTYVQSANVGAMEAVYEANTDIVKGVKWSATLETSYAAKSGRGTCIRCAALDGTEYITGDSRPPCPLHPRCRCVLLPLTKSWREMGLDMDEIEDAYRPYTKRPDQNIDAGGRRTIEEVGFHDGDYATWFGKQTDAFKVKAVGPNRLTLLKSGQIEFSDLVDPVSGRQRTIKELKAL